MVLRCELTADRANARPSFSCHRTCRLSTGALIKPLHQLATTMLAVRARASAHYVHYHWRRESARTELWSGGARGTCRFRGAVKRRCASQAAAHAQVRAGGAAGRSPPARRSLHEPKTLQPVKTIPLPPPPRQGSGPHKLLKDLVSQTTIFDYKEL